MGWDEMAKNRDAWKEMGATFAQECKWGLVYYFSLSMSQDISNLFRLVGVIRLSSAEWEAPNCDITQVGSCDVIKFVTRSKFELGTMVYPRPASLPRPTTWRRFTIQQPAGRSVAFRIQDLTVDKYPAALELLAKYFTQDEPPCKYIEINKHPTAVAELKKLWSTTMEDGLSLACYTDDEAAQLVSVNVLTVSKKEDKEEPFHTEDPVWAALFGAVDLVSKGVDIFEKYGVDRYLTAYGLVVDPAWRGMKIGQHMLEARIPLCKALSLRVTATVFTAAASQCVAKKAGFEDLFEMTYVQLAEQGCVFPGVEYDTKSSKLMALAIE